MKLNIHMAQLNGYINSLGVYVPPPEQPVDKYDPNGIARVTPSTSRPPAKLAYKAWVEGGMASPWDGSFTDDEGLQYLYAISTVLDASANYLLGDITRSTLGTIYNLNRELEYVGADLPRWSYLDGVIRGLYIGDTNTNQLYPSDATTTDLANATNVTDGVVSWLGGKLVNSIVFGDNSVARHARLQYPTLSPVNNALSIFVKMDDNSAPVVDYDGVTGDFSLILDANYSDAGTIKIELVDSNNFIYRVSGVHLHDGSANGYGITKELTQSSKGFQVSGWQLNANTDQALPYVPTTVSAVAQNADEHVLTFPTNIDQSGWGADIKCVLTNTEDSDSITLWSASDGTTNNKVEIIRFTDNTILLNVKRQGVAVNSVTIETYQNGAPVNISFSVEEGDFNFSVNGASTVNSTGSIPLPLNVITIGGSSWVTGREANAHFTHCELITGTRTAEQLEEASS